MQVVEDDRQQRATTLLQNVDYRIEAHYEVLSGEEAPQKQYEMFKRRSSKWRCFQQPFLDLVSPLQGFVMDHRYDFVFLFDTRTATPTVTPMRATFHG